VEVVMKRILVALAVVVAGLGSAATVQAYPPYPPGSATLTTSDAAPAPGGTVTLTVSGCVAGEAVTFTLGSATATVACTAARTASASLAVPTTAGAATARATLAQSGSTLTVALVVGTTTNTIPRTGSDSNRGTALVAAGMIVAGVGALGATRVRRRRPV
jgi:hypothetical protein